VGVASVAISSAIGVPLGGVAGYAGGRFDDLIMRTMDIVMSFPPILVAMTITAVLGPTLTNAIIAIGFVYIPYFARITRSETISVSQEEFVEASEAIGERDSYILFREVLPNAAAPIIVQASISIAFAILAAAGLSFLGLGAQPPTPSWGLMLQQAKQYLTQAPWMAIFPGLGIALTVFGFNLFGDGIRDVLDPDTDTEMGG
jgi:peptide/nickel transport system permease protein